MINENSFSTDILNAVNGLFADGRCPHAVLIDGGSEKQRDELARFVAKKTICGKGEVSPCDVCENCRKADENIHPDIITVTKPDDRKFFVKADVKKVVADSHLTPNEARKKVFILSEVQQMNEESQNLLLKVLEEPPEYISFILTSQTANAVIGTVLSRVVRLRLGKSERTEYSEKAVETVKAMANAVSSVYEYDLIKATSPLDGNKKLTEEVLKLFVAVLRDAISLKSGGEILLDELKGQSEDLAEKCTLKKLLDMYDTVCTLYRSLDGNPNYTLLSAVLCARLKK